MLDQDTDEGFDAAEAIVEELYRLLFARSPDADGLRAYAERVAVGEMSVLDMVRALVDSDEFRSRLAVAPDDAFAELQVSEAIELVLVRPPNEEEMERLSSELREGETQLNLIRRLMNTDEFGQRCLLHPTVAQRFARDVITGLMKREPGAEAVAGYSGALQSGYTIEALVEELIGYDEFKQRQGRHEPPIGSIITWELAELAESLIVDQLADRGVRLGEPPTTAPARGVVAAEHMRSMIHTLAMLAADTGGQVRA